MWMYMQGVNVHTQGVNVHMQGVNVHLHASACTHMHKRDRKKDRREGFVLGR